ncbi:putative gustatory receptor clone PTE03 [Anguilla anguilla]|uniref:putative gustatory receptor clone PTE03 n=1 Tax=Anguilla anguilla TaxID=7936 RepID=UPI0015A82CF8|nr:putative gustatory receptor clone PTE03 [Anguilla anguilla]
MENSTTIVFILQRLNETMSTKHTYFAVTLLVYLFTIFVNVTLIVTIILERTLHEPMFIFLCSLCVNGILGACTFYPKILVDLSSDLSVTSYKACLTQIFLLYSYACCEFTTLAMMAYDRYIAICKPLNYHSIITPRKVMKLLIFTWLLSICESGFGVVMISRVPLCGFYIDKIYCTLWAVAKLSCVDTTINNVYGTILSVFHIAQVVLILISYVDIVKASVRSQEERNKFMQTCLPHLISLANFTVSVIFDLMYSRYGPTSRLHALRNFMSVEYLVLPPILNPLIYGLKLNQIRRRIFRICSRKRHSLK